ncbi:chemotaxis protein CheW [Methylobacterium sp. WSM2598]|uniref:chemotaxis protein CheW n=1 Tax=Methylobacterium sp. WSM2598 TaxID=398261 RepID=UPI00036F2C5B|nr:chemotaxis protein CheW [Methylobacterium sp. WSM2598]
MAEAGPGPAGGRVLLVGHGPGLVAVPAGLVREIRQPGPLTPCPGSPAPLLGLCAHRGLALPVLDLGRLLGREAAAPGRLIVAEAGDPVGLLVERVLGFAAAAGEAERLDLPGRLAALPAREAPRRAGLALARAQAEARAAAVGLLRLRAGGRPYALPLDAVEEVLRLPAEWFPAAGPAPGALGRMRRRGAWLPLLGLAALLEEEAGPPRPGSPVIVLRIGGAPLGLVAEALGPVLRLPDEAIDPLPRVLRRAGGALAAVARLDDGDLVPLLAPERLPRPEAAPDRAAPVPGAAREPVLAFDLAGTRYGLPAGALAEVLRWSGMITRLPHAPASCLGLIGRRGEALPVIDLRRLLGHPPGAAVPGRPILVLDGRERLGLMVDAVAGLGRDMRPAPDAAAGPPRRLDPAQLREAVARERRLPTDLPPGAAA